MDLTENFPSRENHPGKLEEGKMLPSYLSVKKICEENKRKFNSNFSEHQDWPLGEEKRLRDSNTTIMLNGMHCMASQPLSSLIGGGNVKTVFTSPAVLIH